MVSYRRTDPLPAIIKSMKYATRALALCFLAGLAGCSSINNESGVQMSQDKVALIKKGVSTRADVETLLGPPMHVAMMPDGKRILSYTYTSTKVEGHATAASYIPYVGLFAGGAKGEGQTRVQSLQVMLNAQGVVDDYEFSDNTRNTTTTSGGLFGLSSQSSTTTTQPTDSK